MPYGSLDSLNLYPISHIGSIYTLYHCLLYDSLGCAEELRSNGRTHAHREGNIESNIPSSMELIHLSYHPPYH